MSISLQMVIACDYSRGHKLGSASHARALCLREHPRSRNCKASVRGIQNIRAKVQALQRTGADLYLDPGTGMCREAKATVVVRKAWWPASLEEIEADGKG